MKPYEADAAAVDYYTRVRSTPRMAGNIRWTEHPWSNDRSTTRNLLKLVGPCIDC